MKKFLVFLVFLLSILPLWANSKVNGEILTFPKNSKAGFEWGYLLYLPKDIDTSQKLPILFIMNNSGVAKDIEEMEKNTLYKIETEKEIADNLGVPLLMPLILRETNSSLYPHELNRAVFISQEGPYKRLDLQVLNMFKDARKQLKKQGISTEKKMLVAGASASGAFAWRFTILHPEYVLACFAAAQHYPTLPLQELNGEKLIYPIGVADFKQYTGKKFNKKAWQKVPLFISEGEVDYNDPLPYDECYTEDLRTLIYKLFDDGKDDTLVRVRKFHEILKQQTPNLQAHIFPNVAHSFMAEDAVKFLKENQNSAKLKTITPTDTSSWTPALPLRVSALYWGKKAPLTRDQEYLSDTNLTLKVQKTPMVRWAKNQKKYRIDIMQKDKEIIHGKLCLGIFYEEKFDLLQCEFSKEEASKLKAMKDKTFNLLSHHPKILDIPEDLTFSVK